MALGQRHRGRGTERPRPYFDRKGARLYDIAFSWRRDREAEFTERCVRKFGGKVPGRLLDVACGGGTFLEEMRSRGWQVVGVDGSRPMLAQARKRLGPDVPLVQELMTEFRAPGRFDLATCWLDSLNYLLTNEDIIEHFRRVARALKRRGFYLLDLSFGSWCAEFWHQSGEDAKPALEWGWSGTRDGVLVYHDGCYGPPCDPLRHLATEHMHFLVRREGSDGEEEHRYQCWKRALHPQEFTALVAASGVFERVEWFTAELDFSKTLDTAEGKGQGLVLLRKVGG
jgi:SAM-dependent methyltransferase